MRFGLAALSAVLSIALVFGIARLTGSRQISSMSIYEYVNSITLGSLAAQLAVAEGETFWYTLIGVVIYGIFTVGSAVLTDKSRSASRFLSGDPIILMENGIPNRENFARARINVDEFCAHLRALGYFDITKVDGVVMETTGQISVLPKASERPMTPNDAKIPVHKEKICRNFIADGLILDGPLSQAGHDRAWLEAEMARTGVRRADDVFLCSEDSDGKVVFFLKQPKGGIAK